LKIKIDKFTKHYILIDYFINNIICQQYFKFSCEFKSTDVYKIVYEHITKNKGLKLKELYKELK
jgi:hypothetical protein